MTELHENQVCLNCGKVDIPQDKTNCPKCGFTLIDEEDDNYSLDSIDEF